jgi:hypothetical protein
MTISDREDQAERRETLENDLQVLRQQGSTFHQHAQAQAADLAGGRFAATGTPRVIGSTPTPAAQYPAASEAHQTELPPEQPLGFSIDAVPELEASIASLVGAQVAGGPADAPSSDGGPACPSGDLVSERAGPSPFQTESEIGGPATASGDFNPHFPASTPRVGPSSVSQKDLDNG